MRGRRAPPVLAELVRGGSVESRHRGVVVVATPDGALRAAVGDPDTFIYLRSAAKPFQLAAFLASGLADEFRLSAEELAVMAASHSGEDRHVRTVQSLLRRAGLSPALLGCGTHAPFDSLTAARLIRDGEPPTPLRHNCSGKHTGMLLFAKASGWSTDAYWRPDHPLQAAVRSAVATACDVPAEAMVEATDGCGVPTFGMPLRHLAIAFARLADPSLVPDSALAVALSRVRGAMIAHPELVAGRRRLDTALMRAEPGRLVAKGGAEGISAVGLLPGVADDGALGLVVGIEDGDGARRAGGVAVCAALGELGLLRSPDAELREFASPAVLDPRGEASGEVRPAFRLH